ncbi:hypothetical protein P4S73_21865 [Paraglaciecola sp. Hal342]
MALFIIDCGARFRQVIWSQPLSIAIVTAIIAWFGEKSVAAFGLATRVEFLLLFPC